MSPVHTKEHFSTVSRILRVVYSVFVFFQTGKKSIRVNLVWRKKTVSFLGDIPQQWAGKKFKHTCIFLFLIFVSGRLPCVTHAASVATASPAALGTSPVPDRGLEPQPLELALHDTARLVPPLSSSPLIQPAPSLSILPFFLLAVLGM